MKILITGSTGFIGYHLCKKLLNTNNYVIGVDHINHYYDIKLKKLMNSILKKYSKYIIYKKKIENLDN